MLYIFQNFIKNFIENYSGLIEQNQICNSIRERLQFNDSPNFYQMSKGEVDCVGANIVTINILKHYFPFETMCIASVPKLYWLDDFINDNKHCVTIRFFTKFNINYLQIIDNTPINGFGYGLISKATMISDWLNIENNWKFISVKEKTDNQFWESMLYSEFNILNEIQLVQMLNITNWRSSINCTQLLDNNLLPMAEGWKRDYLKLKIKCYIKNDSIEDAQVLLSTLKNDFYYNPYVLKEYIKLSYNTDELIYVEQQLFYYSNLIVALNKSIVTIWSKSLKESYKNEDWIRYFYYLGAIFWRNRSINLILNENQFELPKIKIKNSDIFVHKISPAWFLYNNCTVLIDKHINNNSLVSLPYNINKNKADGYYEYFGFTKIYPHTGYISIINNANISENKETPKPLSSHLLFVGLLYPQLLIQNYGIIK